MKKEIIDAVKRELPTILVLDIICKIAYRKKKLEASDKQYISSFEGKLTKEEKKYIESCFINLDKSDNRLENLEFVSYRENQSHSIKKENTSSKYIGVYWNKNANKWQAGININRVRKHLGLFENEIDAYNAYLKALEENGLINKYA
jgi:hypothetical protein